MTLKKKGKYWYGTTAEDVEAEVIRYSTQNVYAATRFRQSRCNCGSVTFKLESDEEVGAARRICTECGMVHLMGDSLEYANEANFDNHVCICGHEKFKLLSGVALYEGSNDIRWYYIGCLCANCQLVGVFADWKCEAGDANVFLAKV
jgi:hypothetical protein